MSIQILENTPDSLKLHQFGGLLGFFIGLIFVSIIFLISGTFLVLSLTNFGEKWSIFIGSISLFFTVIGALGVRSVLLSGHAYILHFDLTTKKLNCYPQSILLKLPVEEIPFSQLEKIEFKENLNTDGDDDNEYLSYDLTLKIKGKSISTRPLWSLLWTGAKDSQRREIEKMAHLISEITGIPYTFSTNKPLPKRL